MFIKILNSDNAKSIVCVILLSIGVYSSSFSQNNPESFKLQEEGHLQLSKGNTEQAIILFSQAIRLDPQEVSLRRDLAYAYYIGGDLKNAQKTIQPILSSSFADEQSYQIGAAIENGNDKPKRALKIINNGLRQFPYSGLLHYQKGVILAHQKNSKSALNVWQKGIEIAPNYSMNYYQAAKAYFENGAYTWAIIYGEVYLNLDQDIRRGLEIRKIVVDAYQNVYKADQPDQLPDFVSNPLSSSSNFINIFEHIMLQNGGILRRGFDMETLIMLRSRILLDWKQNHSIHYPSSLLFYQNRLMEEGYFDVYNQWLFGAYLNSQEFGAWKRMNHETFANFEQWHRSHPLQLAQYDPKP